MYNFALLVGHVYPSNYLGGQDNLCTPSKWVTMCHLRN